ncbi:hypothetical protein JYU18_01305, partial [bacterium AH-315-E07]|nr:hypothetical protein [bacterium AH-315-E07]
MAENAMKNWLSLSLCITLWLATPSLAANDPDRVQQRQAFIAAEKALLAGNLVKFEQLTRQLSDYPLLPYLEYAKLHRHLGSATPASIHTFIERYDET